MKAKLFLGLVLMAFAPVHNIVKAIPYEKGNIPVIPFKENCIQPWSEDPRYWQYKGKPLLLLGGSDDDNLFQWPEAKLIPHLDLMTEAGANYIRNTMSDRDVGNLKAFDKNSEGKFDLNKWNPEYWSRFENLLKWTSERDIIIQIEVWDRFDYSRESWINNPWNPAYNINYSYEKTGFSSDYPDHPSSDLHPFFHSIPGMPNYTPRLDKIRTYQEAYVSKLLSYSLQYGHVLYCMNNETSTPPEWGQYWINFIQLKAAEKEVNVFTTDMFDDAFLGAEAANTAVIFADTVNYLFADISQVNSRNFNDKHWQELIWLIGEVNKKQPRPCNHTKIYGGSYTSYGSGGYEDGIERFWRNILAGSASSRFHRPGALGLSERSIACIEAARLLEKEIKLWDVEPHMDLLRERQPNVAYLAAKPGEQYVLYFTYGGSVGLDLSDAEGEFSLTWISISQGIGHEKGQRPFYNTKITGGSIVTINAPFKGGWVAAIKKAG